MNKKLIAALIVSMAMATPQTDAAQSDLEKALKNPDVDTFIMNSNQSISADLPLNTTRYFKINDDQTVTKDHYFKIIGNGHSGFKADGTECAGYTVSHLKSISGFKSSGNGGAFNVTNDSSLVVLSSIYDTDKEPLMTTISDNYASGKGGAIYSDINWGGGLYLVNTNIENNTAGDKGGGLYLDWGTNKIMALPGSEVVIADNLAYINDSVVNNDIYLYSPRYAENESGRRGSVTLMARATASDPDSPNPTGPSQITIGDIRAEGSSDIRILSSKNDTAAGFVDIGSMSLDNDAMFSTAKVAPNSKTDIQIYDMYMYKDSIINTINGYIDNNLYIGTIHLDNSNNKFMIDANLTGEDSAVDKFTFLNGGTAKLAVNIIGSNAETSGSFSLCTMGNTTFAESTTQYGGLKYTFTQDPNQKEVFHYTTTKDRSITLQEALKDYTLAEYDMPDLTVADSDLGYMYHYNPDTGEFVERTFTINGKGGILITDGGEHYGISIPTQLYPPEDDKLTPKLIVNDLELVSGFTSKASEYDSFAQGGAIRADDAVLELHNVTFSDNIATGAGTAVSNSTFGLGGAVHLATRDGYEQIWDEEQQAWIDGDHFKSIIEDSTFLNNKAISTKGSVSGYGGIVDGGGAVYAKGDLDITGSLFASNSAISALNEGTAEAGALYVTNNSKLSLAGMNCSVNILDTMFMSNIAGDVENEGDALTNTSAYGGAILASRVDMNIKDSSFIDNRAQAAEFTNEYSYTIKGEALGGAICIDKEVPNSNVINIDNTTFAMNKTEVVKSVDNGDGTYTLTSAGVDQSKSMGGAIAIIPYGGSYDRISVNITNSDFIANESGNGGAIYNKGSHLNIKDSNFNGNQANYYSFDTPTTYESDMNGGAIYNASGAKLFLDGVTFSNNYAKQITYDGDTPIVSTVKNDIKNDAGASGGMYFIGNASTLDGGIVGTGYINFNLGEDEFGNVDPNATNTTMTIGKNTNIIQTTFNVNSGTVNIENADNITSRGGFTVGENGTLNILSGKMNINNKYNREIENSGNLYNGGTLDVTGAQYAQTIKNNENAIFVNAGTVAAATINNAGLFYNNGIANGTITNAESGAFANKGEYTGDVDNSGLLGNLDGGTITSATLFKNGATGITMNAGNITAPTITNLGNFFNGIDPQNPDEVVASASVKGNVTNIGEMYNAASIIGNVTNTTGKLTNEGTIKGNVTNNFSGKIANNGTIKGNVNNSFGDFTNTGKINGDVINGVIQNFVNSGKISGNVENNGEFYNTGTIAGDVENNDTLYSDFGNISGKVKMSSSFDKYYVTDKELAINDSNFDKVDGDSGQLHFKGDIISDKALSYTGGVYLDNGTRVTLGNGDAFQGNSKLALESGKATLNLLNGQTDALNYKKLEIDNGARLDVEADWGDTLNSDTSSVYGNIRLSKLDISNTKGGSNYQFTDGYFKDHVGLQNVDLITAKGKANTVEYDTSTGFLSAARTTLYNLIKKTDEKANEDAYYNYAMDSDEAGNDSNTIIGNLKVQGNGHTIKSKGIVVGDSMDIGDVVLKDVNFKNVKTSGKNSGAIHINDNSAVQLQAVDHDVIITGTSGDNKNGIYMETTPDGLASTLILAAAEGRTITIDDDIRSNDKSNTVFFNGNKFIVNGVMDPLTAVNTGSDITRNGADENVTWRLFGGTLKYTDDNYINNPANPNSFELYGGNLDLQNGAATTINLNSLYVSDALGYKANLYLDADLAAKTMDKFVADTVEMDGGGINVAGIKLLSDAKTQNTRINFTNSDALKGNIDYTGESVLSKIFKYNVGYDPTTGDFEFNRIGGGGYDSYNPGLFAAPVAAQLGGYLTQLNSYDQAFMNMDTYMMMPAQARTAMKMRNKIASLQNAEYDDTKSMYDYPAGWFRPYATFETVALHNGPNVKNNMYGSFFGGESSLKELGHGWDGMWGAYVGYNGSHQSYDGVGIYQNGGTLGLTGMAYKGNYFLGGTINVGASGVEASTAFGNDDFAMIMSGVAIKTGYNWELANGKFIIQPSLMTAYSFVNAFDFTNSAGIRMDSEPLHAITIEPGVKFIGNLKNGWQPYAGVSFVYNIMDRTRFHANDVSLPNFSINPFVRYGIGVRKTWGERLTGHFQTYFTNGGRNGIGLSAGLRWAIGKDGSNDVKGQTPELKPTKITLNNHK